MPCSAIARASSMTLRRVQQRLRRDAADVEADAAERRPALDQRDLEAEVCRAERGRVAPGAGTEHDEVEIEAVLAPGAGRSRARRVCRGVSRSAVAGAAGIGCIGTVSRYGSPPNGSAGAQRCRARLQSSFRIRADLAERFSSARPCPADTLSPGLHQHALDTCRPTVDGTSIVAFSLSSVSSGCLLLDLVAHLDQHSITGRPSPGRHRDPAAVTSTPMPAVPPVMESPQQSRPRRPAPWPRNDW